MTLDWLARGLADGSITGHGVNLNALQSAAVSKPKRVRLPKPVGSGTESHVAVPLPPSSNHLFASSGNRRVKTAAYKEWLAVAVPLLEKLKPPKTYPVQIIMTIYGGVNMGRDASNMVKPIEDAVVAAGVIPDDNLKFVNGVFIHYAINSDGEPGVLVSLLEIGSGLRLPT